MRKSEKVLEVGDRAPAFCLHDSEGEKICLKDYLGSWVVLYFYPRDHTPGCTREACDFRDAHQALRRKKVAVLGVSADSAEQHKSFRAQYRLPFALLVDEAGKVARLYGVWQEKQNFGRKYMGIVRSTFVVDPGGRLSQVYRKVQVDGHVQEVLASLRRPRS